MNLVDKLAEAYTQTLQAGMVGITLVGLLVAFALIVIIYIMLKDNRIREDRRAKEHEAQVSFNQSLTASINQATASIVPVPNVLSMLHSSIESSNSRSDKLISVVQPAIDDTKTRLQAIADGQAALHGKVDALPNSLIVSLDAKLSNIEAALISAKDVLTLIRTSKPANE